MNIGHIAALPSRWRSSKPDDGKAKNTDLPVDTVTVGPMPSAEVALTHKPEALKRPVILVNGLARNAQDWDKMVPWLASNPENSFGGVYQKGQDEAFSAKLKANPDNNIFAFDPSNNLASPRVLGGEVRRMIDHVIRETGTDKVDLVAHSQGGLDILAAVDQGEDDIGKVVSLATPWKGAAIASVARRFDSVTGGTLGGILAPVGKDQGALFDLRPIGDNPWLAGVHERWKAKTDKPEVSSISGSGTPTPGGTYGGGVSAGDGFVAIESGLGLPEAHNYHLTPGEWSPGDKDFRAFHSMDVNHIGIVGNSSAFKTVGEILSSEAKPPKEIPSDKPVPKSPIEQQLDIGANLIHDLLRDKPHESYGKWIGQLDDVQEIRQRVVDTENDLLAGELKEHRSKWIIGAGLAAGAVGAYFGGALGTLPGAVTVAVGASRFFDGLKMQKQATDVLLQTDRDAVQLRASIESDVSKAQRFLQQA